MLPSEDDIANFMTVAPSADEGKAFVFLEGADTIDEAVAQFYDNPDKYSHSPEPRNSKLMNQNKPIRDSKMAKESRGTDENKMRSYDHPQYSSPAMTVGGSRRSTAHTNAVIQAANVRARDEQEMQNRLQSLQLQYRVYNPDIEPEHDTEYYCNCPIHLYKLRKMQRIPVQEMWSRAVMYPEEKSYHNSYQRATVFSRNPYSAGVVSPYGNGSFYYLGMQQPRPQYHALSVQQIIRMNASLNSYAQAEINKKEPKSNIWEIDHLESSMSNMAIATASLGYANDKKLPVRPEEKMSIENRGSIAGPLTNSIGESSKSSKFVGFKKALNIKSSEERAAAKIEKMNAQGRELRNAILDEEYGRWPDDQWRRIVAAYQDHVGMTGKIADLRLRQPIQYLHLLRAGYFEPIPVAWANSVSNPLKFSIEATEGWRGITPSWRGYEDTAEERLYWVLNHREGSTGARLKPDVISSMNMARARMASAVEPPPAYFSPNDTCHVQHTSEGYSKQVMPPPFRAYDAPQLATDDTMILLDVSGSMDFDPVRPIYDQYLITGYAASNQPKNKAVAKAIIRRFTDAMINHDHNFQGYQLTTFSSQANYIGTVNHQNLDELWRSIRIGGGTRVMTGWQKVKELHFQKHSESATYHPVFGWQAGPQTPILRVLLLLDGEATDMDEFELDLLGLPWVHVTIFLIGVDGCPHHHRHANELARISEVNHHVSFVDAQGNTPERFVTHELLKRHLGYEISMSEFEELEQPPQYSE